VRMLALLCCLFKVPLECGQALLRSSRHRAGRRRAACHWTKGVPLGWRRFAADRRAPHSSPRPPPPGPESLNLRAHTLLRRVMRRQATARSASDSSSQLLITRSVPSSVTAGGGRAKRPDPVWHDWPLARRSCLLPATHAHLRWGRSGRWPPSRLLKRPRRFPVGLLAKPTERQ
jgi:hypothetical protein